MYKVLLVDDEPAALEALRLAADWESLGYVICGECSNGEEAVRMIESLWPDLVVTDVRMPVMDGLDLVRHAAEHMKSDSEFVLVSGYDEFEYAKRAIKYGIRHYVLKPVTKEEFTAVLEEVRARFGQRDRLKELDAWNRDVEAYEYFERLISGVLEEHPGGVRLTEAAGHGVLWAYAVVEPYFYRALARESPGRIHKSCSDLKSELEMPENPFIIAHIAPLEKEGYGLVLRCNCEGKHEIDNAAEAIQENAAEASLAAASEALRAKLSRIFQANFYLAVSNPADAPGQLKKLVKEAMTALSYRCFKPAGSILFYKDCGSLRLNYSLDCIAGRDDVYESLESLDAARLADSVGKVFEGFAGTFTAPEVVEIYLANVIYKCLELIKSMGGDIEETLKSYQGGMLSFSGLSLDEAKSIFECFCKSVLESLLKLKSTEKQSDMLRVRDYISSHYKGSITIREMSGYLFVHPVYLGHLIHKWFGCGFNEYLNRLRIDEAKRLLSDTNRKIGEIAVEVGYGEYGTFLKQFEKYVRMKPAEYRDICK
ncbi:MAG TPA: response regulator [Clostridia bacterium]|nr:response regulator [Clostridia bacterium]